MSYTTIQLRRGTLEEWTESNPILAEGEIGLELGSNQFKIGNGIDAWTDLGYGGLQGPANSSCVCSLPEDAENYNIPMYVNNKWVAVSIPSELPKKVVDGQVLTYINGQWQAIDPKQELPIGEEQGQVLTWDGEDWQPAATFNYLPAMAEENQVLKYDGETWTASSILPTTANENDILTYDGTNWVAQSAPRELPQNPDNYSVLTYNGTAWVDRPIPKQVPLNADDGQTLKFDSATTSWVAVDETIELPAVANNGQYLVYKNNTWQAQDLDKELPSTVANGQMVIFSQSQNKWIAVDFPQSLPTNAENLQILQFIDGSWEPVDLPTELPTGGLEGQVLTRRSNTWVPDTIPKELPVSADEDQILQYVEGEWQAQNLHKELPPAVNGQILKYVDGSWQAENIEKELPAQANNGQILKYIDDNWQAQDLDKELPLVANIGQILSYTSKGWYAKDLPKELPSVANIGQFLSYTNQGWAPQDIPKELPQSVNDGQILKFINNKWTAGNETIELPTSAANGAILKYLNNKWIAHSYFRGVWSPENVYSTGDIVAYNNELYFCTQPQPSDLLTNNDSSSQLNYKGFHQIGETYKRNDVVIYNNKFYILNDEILIPSFSDNRDRPDVVENWLEWTWLFLSLPVTNLVSSTDQTLFVTYNSVKQTFEKNLLPNVLPAGTIKQGLIINEQGTWQLDTLVTHKPKSYFFNDTQVFTPNSSFSNDYLFVYSNESLLEVSIDIANLFDNAYMAIFNNTSQTVIKCYKNTTLLGIINPSNSAITYSVHPYTGSSEFFTMASQQSITDTIDKIGQAYHVLYKNVNNKIIGSGNLVFNETGLSINKEDPALVHGSDEDECTCVDPIVFPNYGVDLGYPNIGGTLKASINTWGNLVFSHYNFKIGDDSSEGLVLNDLAKYKLRLRNQVGAKLDIEQADGADEYKVIASISKELSEYNSPVKFTDTEIPVADFTKNEVTFHVPVNMTQNIPSVPAGSVMLFYNEAAPLGWTQLNTHHDKALRVVSGTGAGFGGANSFSQVMQSFFSVTGIVGATALTVDQIPAHSHEIVDPGHIHSYNPYSLGTEASSFNDDDPSKPDIDRAPLPDKQTNSSTTGITIGETGGSQPHTHSFTSTSLNFNIQYIDVILCVKN